MELATESELAENFTVDWDYKMDMNCPEHKLSVSILSLIVLFGLVCLIGLIGNVVIIIVVSRLPTMQMATNSYMYIMHVAITDGLFLLAIPFLLMTMVQGSWPFDMILCKVYMMASFLSQFSKPAFFLMMIVDCYIEICRPLSSLKYCTPSMAKVVCVVVWMGAAVVMMPITMYANTVSTKCGDSCNVIWPESDGKGIITFTLFSLFLQFILPLSSIVVFAILAMRKLRYLCCHNEEYLYRMIKLVLTLSFVHLILWLPYWILQLILVYLPLEFQVIQKHIIVIFLTYLCTYLSSALNPFLFILRSEKIKKSLQKFYSMK